MIDQNETLYRMIGPVIDAEEGSIYGYPQDGILLRDNMTFTRSDGSIVSRLYERLTKASRRRAARQHEQDPDLGAYADDRAYRQGVYDAYKALQEELRFSA